MFDGLVERYDLLNGLLSLGLDRRWRRAALRAAALRPGDRVLDLGCGTGDLALAAARTASVTGLDLSHRMLLRARQKARQTARDGAGFPDARPALELVCASAFDLPFADGRFDAALSGFVLRNLDDLGRAFAELARVLRPGGRVAMVDITEPSNPALRRLFDAYLGTVAPALGRVVGKRDEYRYLVRSLAQIPPPSELAAMLERAGFEGCRATALTGGMVTLFTGRRKE
jgi:demethylmenaquinone methyltransferase / 2-methoxy-6-polyprenyl-1,4-benzoquinol methylase